jgi:hypothetical protein
MIRIKNEEKNNEHSSKTSIQDIAHLNAFDISLV